MVTIAGILFSDSDLWNLKQALAAASAPSAPSVPSGPQPTQPPTQPPVITGQRLVAAGTALFDGSRLVVPGPGAGALAVITLQVPTDLPMGARSSLSIFEYASTGDIYRTWLSKTRGDVSATQAPYYMHGFGVDLYFAIGASFPESALFQPGETWYLHVAAVNEFAVKVYPPR